MLNESIFPALVQVCKLVPSVKCLIASALGGTQKDPFFKADVFFQFLLFATQPRHYLFYLFCLCLRVFHFCMPIFLATSLLWISFLCAFVLIFLFLYSSFVLLFFFVSFCLCFSLYLSVFVFLCIFLSLFFFCVCFSFYLSFCQRLPFMFVSLSFYLSSFICPPAFWVYVVSLKCNLHTAMMMSRQMNRVALHTPHWAESWDRHSRPWEWRRKEGLHFKGTRFNNFNFEKSYVCMNKV